MSFRVVTFNAACGNPAYRKAQDKLIGLPFIREAIVGGTRGGPIVALQEVGPLFLRELKAAERSEPFRLLHIGRPGQSNALLIPPRFLVDDVKCGYFVRPQLVAMRRAVGRRGSDWRQLLEVRMWIGVRLYDLDEPRVLCLYTTHLSGYGPLRREQAKTLLTRVHNQAKLERVVLAGDLNVTPDGAETALFPPLEDMAPWARTDRPAIDWVLACGVRSRGALAYDGFAPFSDHYAKEVLLDYV